ncbi:hypothetical protein AWB77_01092 [Caballeronia fortuita]|uniref:Amidohydrolase-related domain-containing protein n=1 Tax=Caballeronia fortuita TaxID=1777138 RepID=A0A157ZVV4_9BURK|nr:hypothetical protein [Caballeronia fortuita]SAK49027.1 hypothetical protein AWB77_01092 [Caballeronia fortuita]
MQLVIENLYDSAGLLGARRVFRVPRTLPATVRALDASRWQVHPALYDADTLLTLRDARLDENDREIALAGGVARLNASIGWQRMADREDAAALLRMARDSVMPRVRLLLSVMPDHDTSGFAAWFAEFAPHAPTEDGTLVRACKLYGREPHFQRNLDAVWDADWLPVVFTADPRAVLAQAAQRQCAVVFRHAASAADVDAMHAGPALDVSRWVASSPQYLLPVEASRRASLIVRPPLSDDTTRDALLARFNEIDLIATDHVARGSTTGPGLQSQHHFLPALLTLADSLDVPAHAVLGRASSRPAMLFGQDPTDWAAALVSTDPPREGSVSGIDAARDPFNAASFKPRVMAIVHGDTLWPTRHLIDSIPLE